MTDEKPKSAEPTLPEEEWRKETPREGEGEFHPDLTFQETRRGTHPGDTYVRVVRPLDGQFRRVAPGYLRATEKVHAPKGWSGKFYNRVKRFLIGQRLPTAAEIHERLDKKRALAVFASDAISSSAYATDEILLALLLAGSGALAFGLPIAMMIALLLVIVAFSYRQTVFAYPSGGGSYIVSRENLGMYPGLIAASALLIDYVLTVSVSIASGVAQITSAFPALLPNFCSSCFFRM